ncbi:MAG: hypothetical protein ACC658_01030 [Acidimicrobiia bacterium]
METAAIVAAVGITLITIFQISLALGAPAGGAAWGGRYPGVLPTRLRVASGFVGVFFYPVVVVFVLDAGGVVETGLADGSGARWFMWILAGLFTLGALANFASKSKVERLFWGSVALIIAVSCGIIAAGM